MGTDELIAESGRLSDVSHDGRLLLQLRDGLTAISLSDSKTTNFLKTSGPVSFDEARFSPDTRWVAFNSDETGRAEVYLVPYPSADTKIQVSIEGGVQPRWRRDGRELFYLSLDGKLMALQIQPGDPVRVGKPIQLFQTGARALFTSDEYDVSADGQRFLVVRPASTTASPPLNVVVHWRAAAGRESQT